MLWLDLGIYQSYRIALIQIAGSKFRQYTVQWWSGDCGGDGDGDDDNNNSALVY